MLDSPAVEQGRLARASELPLRARPSAFAACSKAWSPRSPGSTMPRRSPTCTRRVSTRTHPVAVPETPVSSRRAARRCAADRRPQADAGRCSTCASCRCAAFPTATWPGLLDDLNRLGFAYRWMTRFLFMSKADATRELTRLRRQWFAKRKGVITLLRETIFQQEAPLRRLRRRQQGAGCRCRAAGARQRRRGVRLCHRDGDRHGSRSAPRPTTSSAPSSARSRAAASSPIAESRSTASKRGCRRCRVTSTPTCASRSSRR